MHEFETCQHMQEDLWLLRVDDIFCAHNCRVQAWKRCDAMRELCAEMFQVRADFHQYSLLDFGVE